MSSTSNHLPVEFELENGQMNKTHGEFLVLVEQLSSASDEAFALTFGNFVTHTKKHFAEENEWMFFSKYPEYEDHAAEHSKVLEALMSMQSQVEAGQLTNAKDWINNHASEWFEHHVLEMNSAFCNHLYGLSSEAAALKKTRDTDGTNESKLEEV